MRVAWSCIAFACVAGLAWATTQEKPTKPAADDTPLMVEMKKMDAAFETLKKCVRDPTKDADSLAVLVTMEQAALASKQLSPKMLPHVKEAERAKFLVDYRKGMAALLTRMLELETTLLDGDRARVRELERKLETTQQDAHNAFTEGE